MAEPELYEKLIYENEEKNFQYRLVVSEFRGVQYISLRKYFQSYEGEWIPTKEGATIPASIETIFGLLNGLIEICSYEESADVITAFFGQKIADLKSKAV